MLNNDIEERARLSLARTPFFFLFLFFVSSGCNIVRTTIALGWIGTGGR